MDRRQFLGRSALVVGGVLVAPRIPLEIIEAPVAAAAIEAAPAASYAGLIATGGICAPLTPFYALPALQVRPFRDVLPAFTASRGGLDIGA